MRKSRGVAWLFCASIMLALPVQAARKNTHLRMTEKNISECSVLLKKVARKNKLAKKEAANKVAHPIKPVPVKPVPVAISHSIFPTWTVPAKQRSALAPDKPVIEIARKITHPITVPKPAISSHNDAKQAIKKDILPLRKSKLAVPSDSATRQKSIITLNTH